VERPTVAIFTDDAAFANALTRRWLTEREIPTFVLMQSDSDFGSAFDYDLAVVVRINPDKLAATVDTLKMIGRPVILLSSVSGNSSQGRSLICLPEVEEWPTLVVVLAQQVLYHQRIKANFDRMQELNSELEREASLGRYMLEVRHNLNNALTSVLGNSDLILLDSDQLPASLRSQVETIRNMGMRMNEIMHRFSSLQKEMQLMEQQNGSSGVRVAAAGAV
jgi:signal transduction histidine kinase